MSVTRDGQGRTEAERKAVRGAAWCKLCEERVRDRHGLWLKEVVLWRGVDVPICVECAGIVHDLYEGAGHGLYLGPGRQVV